MFSSKHRFGLFVVCTIQDFNPDLMSGVTLSDAFIVSWSVIKKKSGRIYEDTISDVIICSDSIIIIIIDVYLTLAFILL